MQGLEQLEGFRHGQADEAAERWDYRIIITYADPAGATHETQVEHELFPDRSALKRDEQTRWELTLNHWDLPIHDIDPHATGD